MGNITGIHLRLLRRGKPRKNSVMHTLYLCASGYHIFVSIDIYRQYAPFMLSYVNDLQETVKDGLVNTIFVL